MQIFPLQIKEKAKANAEQFCGKYGKHRMPFLWTGIHLIDVISDAAGAGESASQAEKEQTFNREISARRVIMILTCILDMQSFHCFASFLRLAIGNSYSIF